MIKKPLNIAIVILAAGASKRMGTPKQLLPWGDTSLLVHTIKTVLKVQAKEVVVVLGANYDRIRNEINQYPISILNNVDWEMGLGKSIAFAIDYFKNSKTSMDGVLVVLADQPFIISTFLEEMIEDFKQNKNKIVATSYGYKNQGAPVLFDKVYFEELSQLHDDHGAKHLLKTHKSQIKTLIPPMENVDLDSIEDYQIYGKS